MFIILLLDAGLVKIEIGTEWYYLVKFGSILGILGIGFWIWYNAKVNNHPPIHYLQLALFVPFTIDLHLHYAFIFLTIILFNKKLLLPWNSPLKPIYLLFIWGLISYVVNQFVEFNPFSFPLFIGTFFSPIIFVSLFFINSSQIVNSLLFKTLYKLILLVVIILVIQTILFWNLHPDLRNGGLNNAHMAGAYLCLTIILIYFKTFDNLKVKGKNYKNIVIILFLVLILFLIDAKYIIVALGIAIFIAETLKNFIKNKIKYISVIIVLVVSLFTMYITNQKIILSILSIEEQNFRIENVVKQLIESPRGQIFNEGLKLPLKEPILFLIGSGPGTFLSRATENRTNKEYQYWLNNFDGPLKIISKPYRKLITFDKTWVQEKYLINIEKNKFYSSSIFAPNGGIISFYFEFGCIGLLILFYIPIYIYMNSGKRNKINELLAISFFMFIIYSFGNWLEMTNFLILSYSIIGIHLRTSQ